MLTNVWTELQYRHDIRRATHGALIEYLSSVKCGPLTLGYVT